MSSEDENAVYYWTATPEKPSQLEPTKKGKSKTEKLRKTDQQKISVKPIKHGKNIHSNSTKLQKGKSNTSNKLEEKVDSKVKSAGGKLQKNASEVPLKTTKTKKVSDPEKSQKPYKTKEKERNVSNEASSENGSAKSKGKAKAKASEENEKGQSKELLPKKLSVKRKKEDSEAVNKGNKKPKLASQLSAKAAEVIASIPSNDKLSDNAQEIIHYKHAYEDPDWIGNEDDNGSVASGVLEEDYCFECGLSTLETLHLNNVILCDICDGEYHLECVGLDRIPRSTFVCNKCSSEQDAQKGLNFNVSDAFKVTYLFITRTRMDGKMITFVRFRKERLPIAK
jgi:hypothetical protein